MKVDIGKYPDIGEDRTVDVHIDEYDVWNMDQTLAQIITPMLKMLREVKQGAGSVDDVDVPEDLRRPVDVVDVHETDDNWFNRWNYVLDQMIWSFETMQTDWEDQFHVNNKFDFDSHKVYYGRIQKGVNLFGKYYFNLWD
jgi:hypothetical protein